LAELASIKRNAIRELGERLVMTTSTLPAAHNTAVMSVRASMVFMLTLIVSLYLGL
jgi:hypothetical protein